MSDLYVVFFQDKPWYQGLEVSISQLADLSILIQVQRKLGIKGN
jgi:hypothetical protein